MSIEVEVGTKAIVTVPASTANLGPGYDTLGMALSLYDTVEVEVTTSGLTVEIFGEGAEDLPRDGSHLVVKAIRSALSTADATVPGPRGGRATPPSPATAAANRPRMSGPEVAASAKELPMLAVLSIYSFSNLSTTSITS